MRLIPHAVKGLTAAGAIDANGDQHDLDVIVLATGFDAANYLGNFTVNRPGGVELHEQWAGEPQAFLGLMVPGFPNFFMLYGPNTNSAPLVSFYEAQARFAARAIRGLAPPAGGARSRVGPLTRRYNDWLQARLARTVWARDPELLPGPRRAHRVPVAVQRQLLHHGHPPVAAGSHPLPLAAVVSGHGALAHAVRSPGRARCAQHRGQLGHGLAGLIQPGGAEQEAVHHVIAAPQLNRHPGRGQPSA